MVGGWQERGKGSLALQGVGEGEAAYRQAL